MTLLEQIRAENPSLELIPDEELIDRIVEQYQGDVDPETFRKSLTSQGTENQAQLAETAPVASATVQPTAGRRPIGVGSDPDEIGYGEAFASGLKSMWQRTWGPGVNYLKGGISGLLGDEETAQQYYQEARQQDQEILNRTGYITFDQAVNGPDAGIDTFVKFGLQQAGMSLPYTLFGGVGGIAGRAVLGQAIGKTAATMTGATASFLPTTAQFNIARQVEEVERGNLDEVNEAAAFGAALPAAVLESALYPVLGKLFGPLSRTQFSNVISSATLGRVAKGSATGAVTEAITEVGQQAIERYQAGLPIDSPDAINEYKEAAAGAAFVGGLFGGATTTAGELARTVQPTPTDAPVTKPVEAPAQAPKVEAGIIQPQQQKETAQTEATQEQAKPVNFSVEKEADRFVVKRQDLDENNNVVKTTPIGAPTTEEAATKLQQEAQDQKNKLPEQTFFTADEIKQQDPTLGNIIDEVESQGAKISPATKQLYYTKDLALPKGDLTNVMKSGGTANSIADGYYDRTSDLLYVSLADLNKVEETVAHENFHALQRVTDRVSPNLFTQEEQTALDTFLPSGTIDSISPAVQKALGNDVMSKLRERHADRPLDKRELQAYAFAAYTTLQNKNRLLPAPNPVIRAFKKLFDFIKRAGNIFRKNKITSVKDIFDKARLGDIGKRAKPRTDVDIETLRTKSIEQSEKAAARGEVPTTFQYSVTTVKPKGRLAGRTITSIVPSQDSVYGEEILRDIYDNDMTKPAVEKKYLALVLPEQRKPMRALISVAFNEKELNLDGKSLSFRGAGKEIKVGDHTSRRSAFNDYEKSERENLQLNVTEALKLEETRKKAPTELSVSKIELNSKEAQYLDELVNKRFDGGTLIDDYAPSIKVRGSTFTISKNEIGKFDEYLDEFNDLERKSRGGEGMLSIPYRLRKLEYGKKRLHKITNDLDKAETISESDVDEGRPELALSTVKFREKPPKKFKGIKALGKFFDDKVKKSDPLEKNAYNRALDSADKEIKYQLDKQNTGVGWYDTDVAEMFQDLQEKIPSLQTQDNKDLFTIIVGITSPQTTPTENVVKAARVYSYYEKFGALAIKQPGNELNFGRTTITQQLSLLQYLLDTKGKEGTVDFLNSTHDVRDLDKVLQQSGAAKYGSQFTDSKGRKLNYSADSKIAGAVRPRNQRNEVLGSYLFGNKIGSYYLNISGVADKEGDAVTKDLWAARSFYRQFGQVVDNTKSAQDGLKGAFLPIHRETGDKFFRELGKRNDLSAKDAQAVLWFYEHELFGDLGINNVPALYLSSGSKKYINNYDKGENYGTVELENRKPSIEVKNRIGQKKEAAEETLTKDKATETKNLDELTPELSISKNKTLLNPPGSKITVDLAEDLETLENFGIQPTDNVKEEIELLADKLFIRAVEDYGDLKNIEQTGIPIFVAGIRVDGTPVGFIQGARAGDVGFIDYVGLYREGQEYISPIGFRRVGKELSKLIGVKQFAGQRITGARKEAQRKTDKFLDPAAISADFSQQQFDEADSVQFSVSDKMLTDKEIQDSALPINVKAKLFENRKLKDGTPVSIRPNLNGQVVRDDKKLFVQTIHPGKNLSKALGYDGAVRVTDPLLNVSQKARANIASGRQNKFPMAAAQGKLSKKKATLEGQVLNFNPFQHHLFVDPAGYAVKSIKGDAVMFNTQIYTTGTLDYYSKENAPTPLENIESNVLYKYETEAEKKADQPLETDTLSKEKLREFNLEFAASDEGITSEVQQVMDVVNPARSRKTIAAHWKDFVDNWTVKFRQAVTDQYISVKKFVGEEEYKALSMTYGSSGATEAALLYGVPFMDNDGAIDLKADTIGTGLFTRFEKLGDKLEQFLVWVAANRARVLAGKGFTTGFPDVAVLDKAIKDLYKIGGKAFDDAYKDLTEFNNAFLDIAVKSGYLDPASAKVWKEDNGYNFYIPFYRLLEDPDSNSGPKSAADIVNQPDYPKFRGSNLPVNDLMRNIIRNYAFLTEASLKNAAGFKTLEKAVEMGVATRVPNKTKTSVFVRNKGKIQHYEVENKLVLESLTALNWNGWQNPAMGALRTFKRYLTYGVTASPAFRIRNLLRDSIHSVAVGPLKYNPIENVMEGGKGLLNKKKGESELRARLAFGGGSIHFGHIYGDDPNATQMLLDRAIDVNTVMKRDGFTAGARRILNSRLKNALKNWEEVGSFGENVNRAALYKQLRDKGVSHFEAAYQARDLLNFSRHGASPAIRFLTQSIPFLNARIQGLDKLGRAMTKGQRAQLISVLGTYSLASIALYLAYKDDEDFKAREQWDRDTYHWFKIPGTEGAIRLPRPFEVGAIGVIFERMVEQMVDDDVHGQLLAERISHVITETFAIDIRPQLITPALEVYANKDSFTGRPIESMGMKRLPASERKYAYTSSAYVGASKLLELVSFNQVELSPVQIEHLVQGYFGWVGSTVVSAVSFVDYPRKAAEFFTTGWDTPLGMGFFKGLPSVQSKYKTQFYNQLTSMNEVFNLMRLYESRGEYNKALEVAEKNKNVLQWRKSYVKVNTKISQINREIRRIEADKNLTNAEKIDKVRQLNIIKNDMIQNLTEAVLSWEKSTGERVKRPLWWNK